MNTRRTITLGVSAGLLLAGAALAQPHRGARGSMVDHLATALDLTEAQKATATQLETAMRAQAAPLMQQSRQQHAELRTLLKSADPDATQIGEKVLAAHATRAQMKALHDEFNTKLKRHPHRRPAGEARPAPTEEAAVPGEPADRTPGSGQ